MTFGDGFRGHLRAATTGIPACFEVASTSGSGTTFNGVLSGETTAACHGEIYNARDLCNQLGLTAGTPLPQLLAAGWQRWSADLLLRLDGVFALAIRQGDELLLFRDASGLRNLYFHTGRCGEITFSTDLASLAVSPNSAPRLGRRSLHEYLRFLEIAPPHTLFEDITAVEAGQVVRWSTHGVEAGMLAAPRARGRVTSSFTAAVDALDAHLQRSVRTRLEGATRPAAFLSGGIDSALLCAIAAQHRKGLTAVTVGFDSAAYDESPVAQRIASHLGITHQILRFDRQDHLAAFERLGRAADQPLADPASMATVLAFDHCRAHFDAVLDGTGADESLGMMPPRHVRLAVQYASVLPARLRSVMARSLRAVPALAGYAPIVDFEHPADTLARWHGFTRQQIEQLCGEPVSLAHSQFHKTFDRYPRHAHLERYSALLNAMTSDRLNQALLVTDAPVRFPFWDTETDGFIRQLRTDYRYLPGQPKRILRALLARYVPTAIWDLPKHGFNFPLSEFLSGDNFLLLRRHLAPERWRARGLLSVEQVQRYGRDFMADDQRLSFRAWALVVLGAWLEHHDGLLGRSA